MSTDEISCQEFVELVTEYLEGTLPVTQHQRFEAHLQACGGCANYLEQIRQTIHLTGSLSEDTISPPARDHFLNLFRDWKKNTPSDE